MTLGGLWVTSNFSVDPEIMIVSIFCTYWFSQILSLCQGNLPAHLTLTSILFNSSTCWAEWVQFPFLSTGKLRMIRRWRLTKKPKQKVNEEGRKGRDWLSQKVPDDCEWLLSSVLVVNGELLYFQRDLRIWGAHVAISPKRLTLTSNLMPLVIVMSFTLSMWMHGIP